MGKVRGTSQPAGDPCALVPWWCPATLVLLVAAGSLAPFDFVLPHSFDDASVGLSAIGWPVSDVSDLLTNLVVYLPLGVSTCLWLCRRTGYLIAGIATLAGCAGLSLLLEATQTIIPQRVASWVDVTINVGGTAIGVVVAPFVGLLVHFLTRRAAKAWSVRPVSTATVVLGLVLLVVGLLPFDFVSGSTELHRSLSQSRWLWLSATVGSQRVAANPAALVSAMEAAALFAVFGFMSALSSREKRRTAIESLEHALGSVILLAVLVEILQLFVCSRVSDSMDAVLNICCGALGAYCALFAVDEPSGSSWIKDPAVLLRPIFLAPILFVQLAVSFLGSLPFGKTSPLISVQNSVVWVPFASYYQRSLTSVLAEVLSIVGYSALLALTIALLLRPIKSRLRWLAPVAVVGLLALAQEYLQYRGGVRTADTTDVLLAIAGAIFAARIASRHFVPVRPADPAPESDPAAPPKAIWAGSDGR